MIANMIKTKMPKDIVILITEAVTCAIMVLLSIILKPDRDFFEGMLWGLGGATFVTAIVIFTRRILGKRKLGEEDEREARIKEKAGLFSLMISASACSLFAVAAFARPAIMQLGTGYVMAGASAFMLLLYFLTSLFFSKRI